VEQINGVGEVGKVDSTSSAIPGNCCQQNSAMVRDDRVKQIKPQIE
jgi:anti-sigma28 factor (negative regulator of flagellin synthesis)